MDGVGKKGEITVEPAAEQAAGVLRLLLGREGAMK
jgi:hypothetical protein